MIKRIIAVSVLGVSALGMMAANATTNGFYVDGQVGYAPHTGNKFTGLPSDLTVGKDKKAARGSIAGRLAIGYQFTKNWAAELGYTQFGQQKSNLLMSNTSTTTEYVVSPFIIHGDPVIVPVDVTTTTIVAKEAITINQHAFDIVGKGIYPISDKFNVYAKAGMAYLTTTVKSKGDMQYQGKPATAVFSKNNWAPEAGIGLTYDITPNVFIDTSFTHIQPIGKNKPANIDFATVGIGYSFG
ncbi:outer membrane beta-barrel protein [Rickettsiella endosymbiont of Miltochrista miniata]|uniref:outer membrane beta-barrel protein n=1 Tax=Rickettsiella endosymbiont of Miltochrista miniata TaxID=3066239 RepID=UPI00313C5723